VEALPDSSEEQKNAYKTLRDQITINHVAEIEILFKKYL
jgi:hypothetical protein